MTFFQFFRSLMKKRNQVYILPTRMGGYLIGLIFLMFLMSVGYSNNLLIIFTLVLFSMNLIWLIQTHFHLHALGIQWILVNDGHAGEPQLVKVFWEKSPSEPLEWEIWLEEESTSIPVRVISTTKQYCLGEILIPDRGHRRIQHIRIKTNRPFGLYQVWRYFKINTAFYVFPRKLKSSHPLNFRSLGIEVEDGRTQMGANDFWSLKYYQGGESKRISWKHYARSGELLVKEGQDHLTFEVHFKLLMEYYDKEFVLSKLATQMVVCHQSHVPFSLETFQKKISLGSSEKHLFDCLRELAKC